MLAFCTTNIWARVSERIAFRGFNNNVGEQFELYYTFSSECGMKHFKLRLWFFQKFSTRHIVECVKISVGSRD